MGHPVPAWQATDTRWSNGPKISEHHPSQIAESYDAP